MTAPFLASRDKLAAVLHQAIRTTGPGIHCDHLADAILASDVVVTPDAYLLALAEDYPEARFPLRALAAALATPTTEEA